MPQQLSLLDSPVAYTLTGPYRQYHCPFGVNIGFHNQYFVRVPGKGAVQINQHFNKDETPREFTLDGKAGQYFDSITELLRLALAHLEAAPDSTIFPIEQLSERGELERQKALDAGRNWTLTGRPCGPKTLTVWK